MSKRSGCKKFLGVVAGLGLTVLAASNTFAGFTTINAPNYGKGGEDGQAAILSNVYGGTFTASGLDFTNGTLTATRVDDSLDLYLPTSTSSVKALASFASYSQQFGYGSTSSPTVLFSVTGKGYAVTGSGTLDVPANTPAVRSGTASSVSSLPSDNPDGVDHLVSYVLTGAGVKSTTYVLFFEDKTIQEHSDFDFNDLVVEVKAGSPVVVPLPAAVWSGLITLAGGAAVTGYRKARRLA